MNVSIRNARLSDVPALLEMERQSPGASHWTPEQYNKLIAEGFVFVFVFAVEHASGIVGLTTGLISGFVCAKAVAGEWEIENVVVAPAERRRGIADALIGELIGRARSDAASAIFLEVRESNLVARRLYEKHGFRETGRRKAYYTSPLDDAIMYSLKLNS
ncbi:MAG TPA: ribosomal protein S18-alanine N-acetyltransferase [Terriglobales bacterium]|nr:ribosomal protein S18-alanine N-acetyltransferase [Terriglobales bacterium]